MAWTFKNYTWIFPFPHLVVTLRVPPMLKRPLQVVLQPLHGSVQVLLRPGRLPLRPLTGL